MATRLAALALVLFTFPLLGAELSTLKGDKITGDVVRLTDKEVVLSVAGKEVATPVLQVLRLDFPTTRVKPDEKYADVELTDGTVLHCKSFAIKGKEMQMKTLLGQDVKLPLSGVANVLNNAGDEKARKDWTERLNKKRRRDVLAILRDDVINPLEGTLGDGNDEGTQIEFTLGGKSRQVELANVYGLIFLREIDPSAAPVLCKVGDTHGDLIMASSATVSGAGFVFTTPSGARLECPAASLVRLDYSSDKIAFLSQIEPVKVEQPESPFDQYRRDKNLDNRPLRIGSELVPIGLALHAHTELEYDLKGEYHDFRARAGIDPTVGGIDGPVVLKIEGDGKELFKRTFTRKVDKAPVPIALNIKDVQRLRVIVTSGDGWDLGRHLTLAEAKISK